MLTVFLSQTYAALAHHVQVSLSVPDLSAER